MYRSGICIKIKMLSYVCYECNVFLDFNFICVLLQCHVFDTNIMQYWNCMLLWFSTEQDLKGKGDFRRLLFYF